MLSEKYLRKQIRKQLLEIVAESQKSILIEAPTTEEEVSEETTETEGSKEGAEEEAAVAAKAKIESGLKYIFPDEQFELPSSKVQLEYMIDMFRTAIESAQKGKAKVAATKVQSSTKTMKLGEGRRSNRRRR